VVLGVFAELMIQSRVEALLGAVGEPVRALPAEPGAAAAVLEGAGPVVVVLDLTAGRALRDAVLEAARRAGSAVIAFGPHVDTEGFDAARRAGAVEVLPRGALPPSLVPRVAKHPSRLEAGPGMAVPPPT
jgi:hypothetical protein